MNVNLQGTITELEVLTAATKYGVAVSLPFGDKQRYDQIWDYNNHLYRIQVKTARSIDEQCSAIEFSCYTVCNGKKHTYTNNEIDFFATFWNNQLYLISIQECSTSKILRFFSPQPNQPNISWAKDYTFEEVIKRL